MMVKVVGTKTTTVVFMGDIWSRERSGIRDIFGCRPKSGMAN